MVDEPLLSKRTVAYIGGEKMEIRYCDRSVSSIALLHALKREESFLGGSWLEGQRLEGVDYVQRV